MWKEVDEERYWEMFYILPPAHLTGKGFQVGESATHRKCKVSDVVLPTYFAFIEDKGRYYEGPDLTIPEFNVFDVRQLRVPSR